MNIQEILNQLNTLRRDHVLLSRTIETQEQQREKLNESIRKMGFENIGDAVIHCRKQEKTIAKEIEKLTSELNDISDKLEAALESSNR